MKRVPKVVILLVIVGISAGVGTAYYLYNKPHKNIDQATPDIITKADELYKSFEKNDSLALAKFKDKIVEISGTIDKIDFHNDTTATILLAIPNAPTGSIKCGMDANYLDRIKGYMSGEKIKIKGNYSGINKLEEFGMIMLDVELTRCVVVN